MGYSPGVVCSLLIAGTSLVVEHGVLGVWASVVVAPGPQRTFSVAGAHRSPHSEACEILLDGGLTSCLLHWWADSLPLSHQGGPKGDFLFFTSHYS